MAKTTPIYEDNKSCIEIFHVRCPTDRTKCLEVLISKFNIRKIQVILLQSIYKASFLVQICFQNLLVGYSVPDTQEESSVITNPIDLSSFVITPGHRYISIFSPNTFNIIFITYFTIEEPDWQRHSKKEVDPTLPLHIFSFLFYIPIYIYLYIITYYPIIPHTFYALLLKIREDAVQDIIGTLIPY